MKMTRLTSATIGTQAGRSHGLLASQFRAQNMQIRSDELVGHRILMLRRSSPLCGCCQVVVGFFFEVGLEGGGVAALVPGRIVVPRSGSGLSEEPAFGV